MLPWYYNQQSNALEAGRSDVGNLRFATAIQAKVKAWFLLTTTKAKGLNQKVNVASAIDLISVA